MVRNPKYLVFANILMAPLIDLAPAMAAHVAPGGTAILSGLLNEQADQVIAAYTSVGFKVAHNDQIGEWTTLVLTKNQVG